MNVPVNGIHVTALIDTGSTHTLISKALYHKLPRFAPLTAAPRLISITDDEIPTLGSTIVRVASVATPVVVCHDLQVPLLLGADVL